MIKDGKVRCVVDGKEEWRSIIAYNAKPLEQNTFLIDMPPEAMEAVPAASRHEVIHATKDGEIIIIKVSL